MRATLTFFVLCEGGILPFCGIRVDSQKTSQIATAVAVVGSRPHSHDIFIIEQLLVSLVDQLMRAGNEGQSIVFVELVDHSRPEQPSNSSMILRPSLNLLGVRPHEISEGALSGYFLHSIDLPNLVKGVNIGRESSVYTENVILLRKGVLSTSAARGRKSKVSLKVFQALELPYFLIISSWKP